MITLEVNVFEHSASRTASLFTSRIRRILTTLHDGKMATVKMVINPTEFLIYTC